MWERNRNSDLAGPKPESGSTLLAPAGIPEFGYFGYYHIEYPARPLAPLATEHWHGRHRGGSCSRRGGQVRSGLGQVYYSAEV